MIEIRSLRRGKLRGYKKDLKLNSQMKFKRTKLKKTSGLRD